MTFYQDFILYVKKPHTNSVKDKEKTIYKISGRLKKYRRLNKNFNRILLNRKLNSHKTSRKENICLKRYTKNKS